MSWQYQPECGHSCGLPKLDVIRVRPLVDRYIFVILVPGELFSWAQDCHFLKPLEVPTCVDIVRCFFRLYSPTSMHNDFKIVTHVLRAVVRCEMIRYTVQNDYMIEKNSRIMFCRCLWRKGPSCHLYVSIRPDYEKYIPVFRWRQSAEYIHCDKLEWSKCRNNCKSRFRSSVLRIRAHIAKWVSV